ncbi:MAG: type II secretion system F family protein [Acidimicrobiia bacterium]
MLAALAAASTLLALGPPRRVSIPAPRGSLLATAGGGILMALVLHLPVMFAVAGISGSVAIPELARRRARRRAASVTAHRWPDFLAFVRGRIAAGEPLPDAVGAAARSLGPPFTELDQKWGDSFSSRLEAVRIAWADPLADRVLTTLRVAAVTGGSHVDSVLSALAKSLSDEIRLRRAHKAALTEQQMTAGVALVSPWLILALSLATNPQAGAAFATDTGHAILVLGAAASLIGYLLARRAGRLSAPTRVFE